MAVLQYDFRIIGMKNIDRALRSMERRFAAHNAAVSRQMGTTTRQRVSPKAKMDGLGKAMHDIGKLAERLERKEYAQKMRNIKSLQSSEIKADKVVSAAAMKNIAKEIRARQAFRRTLVGAGGKSAAGMVGAVGRTGTMMAGMGGGMLAAGAIGNQKMVEGAAAALANQAFRESPKAGEETRSRGEIQRSVIEQSRVIGHKSGLGAVGVISATRRFVSKSGNLKAAQTMMPFIADIANATDSDVGDVGNTAGQMMQNLQFAKGLDTATAIRETMIIMTDMAGQAKVGAIEFKELSTNMGKLASSTSMFDGQASDLVATMGAIGQISLAGGSTSAEESMTSLNRFADDLAKNHKKFAKIGVRVWTGEEGDGRTMMRNPQELLFDAIEKSNADIPQLQGMFGIRSKKSVMSFATQFAGAKKEALGQDKSEEEATAIGVAAMHALMNKLKDARMSPKELGDSSKFREGQGDRNLTRSLELLNAKIGQELLPTFVKLAEAVALYAPEIAGFMSAVASVVEYLLDNPFKGIGAIILAKVGADVAMAGIGQAIMVRMGIGAAAGSVVPGVAGAVVPGVVAGFIAKARGGIATAATATAGAGAAVTAAAAAAAAAGVGAALYQVDELFKEVGGKTRGGILDRAARISMETRDSDSIGFGGHELGALFNAFGEGFSDIFGDKDAVARIAGIRQTGDPDKALARMNEASDKGIADTIAAKQLEAAEKQLEAAKLAKEAAGAGGVNTGSGPTEPREGGGKK